MMEEATRTALEESIKHWQENVEAKTPRGASVMGVDCALCKVHYEHEIGCGDCPVLLKTGYDLCYDSPWESALSTYRIWKSTRTKKAREAFREAAQAEVDFLISLRPTP